MQLTDLFVVFFFSLILCWGDNKTISVHVIISSCALNSFHTNFFRFVWTIICFFFFFLSLPTTFKTFVMIRWSIFYQNAKKTFRIKCEPKTPVSCTKLTNEMNWSRAMCSIDAGWRRFNDAKVVKQSIRTNSPSDLAFGGIFICSCANKNEF